jgi:lambda repressor-like predicted transcriptional regulator
LGPPRAAIPNQPQCPPTQQAQTLLDHEEVAELVAAYRTGGRVTQLATRFGIHRFTVNSMLQREGVTMCSRGIHPDDLAEVFRLYQDGWSLARLAAKFDVAPSTVNNAPRQIRECRAGGLVARLLPARDSRCSPLRAPTL